MTDLSEREAAAHTQGFPGYRRLRAMADELTFLTGHLNAGLARFLRILGEFDAAKGWAADGAMSPAHWLNARCGVGDVAAREYVRVARALPGLPLIAAAFGAGEVSYSKVRAMTRIATPENEDYFLMIARHGTAAHVERLARAYRRVLARHEDVAAASRAFERRTLALMPEDGVPSMVRLSGLLPAEDALIVEHALDALMEESDEAPHGLAAREPGMPDGAGADVSAETSTAGASMPLEDLRIVERRDQRRADALVRMAEHVLGTVRRGRSAPPARPVDALLASVPAASRIEVRLHVDASVLARRGDGGICELEGDGHRRFAVPVETARRLACDASRVTFLDGPRGEPLAVGRRSRTIPPAIRRALDARDRGCRFPGCTRAARLEGHHVRHWVDGGETSLENLVTLCRFHHRLVHEERFRVIPGPDGRFTFHRPDGEQVPSGAMACTSHWMNLVNDHRHRGPDIDERTAVTRWHGEGMDYFIAIQALLRRDGLPYDH